MDIERALVSKAVQGGMIEKLISMGIHSQHFADPACAAVFQSMSEHVQRYRNAPSMDVIKQENPDFNFEVVTDSLEFISEKFIADVKRRETMRGMRDVAELIKEADHDEMLSLDERLLEIANKVMEAVPTVSASKFSEMSSRIIEYEANKKIGAASMGIRMGIPKFDELTLGIQSTDYISFVGWQGTGKSTLLFHAFFHAYLQGKTPMIFSLEMGGDQIHRKFDLMAMNLQQQAADVFKYHDMKALSLPDDALRAWEKAAKDAENAANDIIIVDDIGMPTVERVQAEISRRKPDIVGIDYVTLMEAPRNAGSMWEAVTYITRHLKMTARTQGIPIIAIAQTNIDSADDGAKLSNIAYSRSIGQDSDMVFGLHQTDEMRANKQMDVRMLKQRDGVSNVTVKMYWNPETQKFRDWNPADAYPVQTAGAAVTP